MPTILVEAKSECAINKVTLSTSMRTMSYYAFLQVNPI